MTCVTAFTKCAKSSWNNKDSRSNFSPRTCCNLLNAVFVGVRLPCPQQIYHFSDRFIGVRVYFLKGRMAFKTLQGNAWTRNVLIKHGWISQHPMSNPTSTGGRCRDLTLWLLSMTFKGWILKSWVPTSTSGRCRDLTLDVGILGGYPNIQCPPLVDVGTWLFDYWIWLLRDGYSKAGYRHQPDSTFWLLSMTFKGWIRVGIWFFDFWVWLLRDGYSKAGCRGLIFWLLSMIFKGWILKRQTMTLPRKQKDKGEMTNN